MQIVFSDDSAHLSAQLVSLLYAFGRLVGGKAKGKDSFGVEYKIPWFRTVRNNFIKSIKPISRERVEEKSRDMFKTSRL